MEVDVFVGVRGGITTGFECVGAVGAMGAVGAGFEAVSRITSSLECGEGICSLFEGDGIVLPRRAPILSVDLRGCGEDGAAW